MSNSNKLDKEVGRPQHAALAKLPRGVKAVAAAYDPGRKVRVRRAGLEEFLGGLHAGADGSRPRVVMSSTGEDADEKVYMLEVARPQELVQIVDTAWEDAAATLVRWRDLDIVITRCCPWCKGKRGIKPTNDDMPPPPEMPPGAIVARMRAIAHVTWHRPEEIAGFDADAVEVELERTHG